MPTSADAAVTVRRGPDAKQAPHTASGNVTPDVLQQASQHVAKFTAPQDGRGACVVALSVALWVALMGLGIWWFPWAPLNTWWGLLLSGAWIWVRLGAYGRAFSLMHDAIHHNVFSKRWMNDATSILTYLLLMLDAYDFQRTHSHHHAVLGVEEEAGHDPAIIPLWTTTEWAALPGFRKTVARVLCGPLCMFTLGPLVHVMLGNASWPRRVKHQPGLARVRYQLVKLVIYACVWAAQWICGGTNYLLAELAAQLGASSYAQFTFHAQHAFEGAYRVPRGEHHRGTAGLQGASCMPQPWWWRWVTLGAEYHHIHHFCPAVPGYRTKECHDSAPPGLWEAAGVHQLTPADCVRCMLLGLWDPEQRCYVPFPEWVWLYKLMAPTPKAE